MDDGVEPLERLLVVEDDLRQPLPVEAAVADDLRAELGVPGLTTARAASSASMTRAPSSRRKPLTVLLPEPTPPLRPIRSMAKSIRFVIDAGREV
jgi:hypothetical protein